MTLGVEFRLGDWTSIVRGIKPRRAPDIGQKWTAVLEPRFQLALARLARDGGETRGAARHYREFLALSAGADEGLPERNEAEGYLAQAS